MIRSSADRRIETEGSGKRYGDGLGRPPFGRVAWRGPRSLARALLWGTVSKLRSLALDTIRSLGCPNREPGANPAGNALRNLEEVIAVDKAGSIANFWSQAVLLAAPCL